MVLYASKAKEMIKQMVNCVRETLERGKKSPYAVVMFKYTDLFG